MSSISSIKNTESHKKEIQETPFSPFDDMDSSLPTLSSSLVESLGPFEPMIPVHDCMPFDRKLIGATPVSLSQEELNHEAVVRRGNNSPPEERSMTSAEDKEFKLLLIFLSSNDEHIYKYLLD